MKIGGAIRLYSRENAADAEVPDGPAPEIQFLGAWSGVQRQRVTDAIGRAEKEMNLHQTWICSQLQSAGHYSYRVALAAGQVNVLGDSVDELVVQILRMAG